MEDKEEKKKKPLLKRWWFWVVLIIAIGAVISGLTEDETNITQSVSTQEEQHIEYVEISVDDLMEKLNNNAAVAKEEYKGKYVELKGRLNVVDADLKYIGVYSINNKFDMKGVHCTIKNNEQKEVVKTLSVGDTITVKGKITDVGEIMGYSLDIIEIIK